MKTCLDMAGSRGERSTYCKKLSCLFICVVIYIYILYIYICIHMCVHIARRGSPSTLQKNTLVLQRSEQLGAACTRGKGLLRTGFRDLVLRGLWNSHAAGVINTKPHASPPEFSCGVDLMSGQPGSTAHDEVLASQADHEGR